MTKKERDILYQIARSPVPVYKGSTAERNNKLLEKNSLDIGADWNSVHEHPIPVSVRLSVNPQTGELEEKDRVAELGELNYDPVTKRHNRDAMGRGSYFTTDKRVAGQIYAQAISEGGQAASILRGENASSNPLVISKNDGIEQSTIDHALRVHDATVGKIAEVARDTAADRIERVARTTLGGMVGSMNLDEKYDGDTSSEPMHELVSRAKNWAARAHARGLFDDREHAAHMATINHLERMYSNPNREVESSMRNYAEIRRHISQGEPRAVAAVARRMGHDALITNATSFGDTHLIAFSPNSVRLTGVSPWTKKEGSTIGPDGKVLVEHLPRMETAPLGPSAAAIELFDEGAPGYRTRSPKAVLDGIFRDRR